MRHKRRRNRWALMFVLGIMAVLVLNGCGGARSAGPQIEVKNVWARPTRVGMGGKVTSAAYMIIANKGDETDRLVGIMSDVAEAAEIHQTIREGDVMRMQPVTGGLEIPAGGSVELKPGGYHIMLIGVKRELKPGDRFSLVLEFQKSGRKTIQVEVKEE